MRIPAPRALEKIQKGAVGPGYILMGTELYWRDQICHALQKAMGLEAASFGLAEFDLRQDSLEKVLESAQSQSMFAPRQLLFVKNSQNLLLRRGRQTEAEDSESESLPKEPKARSGSLPAYFANPNPSTTLVFEITDVNLESDDWREKDKAKARMEAFEGVCDLVLLLTPSFEEAASLVRRAVAQRGQKITPEAAEQLVAAFHRNMAQIQLEIEKLCLYDPEKGQIDSSDLTRSMAGGAGEVSLGLSDAIGARNAAAALEALDALRRSGKYAPLILAEVARFLRQLIVLNESQARDAWQASRLLWELKIGAPQSAVPQLMRQARNFTGAELARGLEQAFEADLALRSSPPEETLVLERLVLNLVQSRG